jgi:hypothetical protein
MFSDLWVGEVMAEFLYMILRGSNLSIYVEMLGKLHNIMRLITERWSCNRLKPFRINWNKFSNIYEFKEQGGWIVNNFLLKECKTKELSRGSQWRLTCNCLPTRMSKLKQMRLMNKSRYDGFCTRIVIVKSIRFPDTSNTRVATKLNLQKLRLYFLSDY